MLKKDKRENNKRIQNMLLQSMMRTMCAIDIARKNYEFAEEEMIDYYLYEIKANQSKLNYLIKNLKKNGIELDRIKKIKMKYLEEDQVV